MQQQSEPKHTLLPLHLHLPLPAVSWQQLAGSKGNCLRLFRNIVAGSSFIKNEKMGKVNETGQTTETTETTACNNQTLVSI